MGVASNKDVALYGIRRPRNLTHGVELSRSSNSTTTSQSSSFASTLGSLIQLGSSNSSSNARAQVRHKEKERDRDSKKEDIFRAHKRAKTTHSSNRQDSDVDGKAREQQHTTSGEGVDAAVLARSRRKLQEKARIYAAMQRGDLEDRDARYAVDFDTKWAEGRHNPKPDEVSDDNDDDEEEEEQVDYIDEFGRNRRGTKLEARIAEQQREDMLNPDADSARPRAPDGLIWGDTIQTNAFDISEDKVERMAELAAKRDRSLTPPPEMHFDANAEMRTRGTGFFKFGADEEERRRQMHGLEEMRLETERAREKKTQEKNDLMEKRKLEIAKRREEVEKRRAQRLAGEFLKDLAASSAAGGGEGGHSEGEGAKKE